jgi:hypothetical protein
MGGLEGGSEAIRVLKVLTVLKVLRATASFP